MRVCPWHALCTSLVRVVSHGFPLPDPKFLRFPITSGRAVAAAAPAGGAGAPEKKIEVGADGLIIESNTGKAFESFDDMGLKEELLRGIYCALPCRVLRCTVLYTTRLLCCRVQP